MAAGLECYDAQGRLMFSATDRLARVLGVVDTGAQNGAVVNDGLTTGAPYYAFFPASLSSAIYWPVVTVTGNSLSWSYSNASNRVSGFILFGIY